MGVSIPRRAPVSARTVVGGALLALGLGLGGLYLYSSGSIPSVNSGINLPVFDGRKGPGDGKRAEALAPRADDGPGGMGGSWNSQDQLPAPGPSPTLEGLSGMAGTPAARATRAATDVETPTPTPSPTPVPQPTDTPAPAPTPAPSYTPTPSPTATPTRTPTQTPTDTPTVTPTATATPSPTATATATATYTPSPTKKTTNSISLNAEQPTFVYWSPSKNSPAHYKIYGLTLDGRATHKYIDNENRTWLRVVLGLEKDGSTKYLVGWVDASHVKHGSLSRLPEWNGDVDYPKPNMDTNLLNLIKQMIMPVSEDDIVFTRGPYVKKDGTMVNGIDIYVEKRDPERGASKYVPVYAAMDGIVTVAEDTTESEGDGRSIIQIKHNDEHGNIFYTVYGHVTPREITWDEDNKKYLRGNYLVSEGSKVVQGMLIGYTDPGDEDVGNAAHIEFDILTNSGDSRDKASIINYDNWQYITGWYENGEPYRLLDIKRFGFIPFFIGKN